MDEGGASSVPPSGRAGCHFGAVCIFCTFPADELSDQKRSRSPDFKGHQQLLARHVSVFSWLHCDSGAAALHFCAYGTDENLAVFSDGIESGRPWRDPFCDGNVHLRNGACSPYLHDTI